MPIVRFHLLVIFLLVASICAAADDSLSAKIIIRSDLSPEELAAGNNALEGRPGVGLAASGGGARGLALIGILKVLERENIKIDFIAGVSMGGIIGGLYSCGYSASEIEKLAYEIEWSELLSAGPQRTTLLTTQKGLSEKSLFKLRFQDWKPVIPRALTSAQNLNQLLESLMARAGVRPCVSFDYLNPALRIVCTDLLTGERVVISSGSISEAMRASMAIPVAFTPVEIGGRLLVDGGLVDPIPVDVVRSSIKGPVIAINVSSNLLPASHLTDIVDIADQTTSIMSIDKRNQAMALADFSITPDLGGITNTDFGHIGEIIRAGEGAAVAALPALRTLLARTGDHSGESSNYTVIESEVCDLVYMPKTFFLTAFANSSSMTARSIKDNLNSAVSSGYVSEAWAELIPESTSYSLYYHLRDNPRINAIDFRGASLHSRDELLRLIDCRPGMVSNHLVLRSDVKTLEKFYIESGYTLARVSTEFEDKTGLLTFKIDEGRINAVGIEGNRKTRRWVISRNIPFRAGDLFVQRKAEKAVEDIYSTGLFETAKLNIYPDSAGITLVARVEEKPYDYVRAGARFDLEYKSRAFVDLVADNVFGGGQSLFLSTTVGEKKRSAALNYHVDRIFSSLFTGSARAEFTEFKRNHYEDHSYEGYFKQKSYGAEIMPGRQIPQLGAISFVASLRKFIWRQPGREGEIEFTKLGLGVRSLVDTRDAISFADVGKVHLFELEFASDIRNEKTAYTRFYTSLEAYYRVTRRFNFHPRLALGASSDFMPYFDEFSLGGLNRFLGLHEDEYLGDKLMVAYLELRQKVGDRFFIMGRYDAGNVWNKLERVKLSTLRHGGGLGVGMKTPLGPAQLWYGRTTKGLDSFYLDIGYDW